MADFILLCAILATALSQLRKVRALDSYNYAHTMSVSWHTCLLILVHGLKPWAISKVTMGASILFCFVQWVSELLLFAVLGYLVLVKIDYVRMKLNKRNGT